MFIESLSGRTVLLIGDVAFSLHRLSVLNSFEYSLNTPSNDCVALSVKVISIGIPEGLGDRANPVMNVTIGIIRSALLRDSATNEGPSHNEVAIPARLSASGGGALFSIRLVYRRSSGKEYDMMNLHYQ